MSDLTRHPDSPADLPDDQLEAAADALLWSETCAPRYLEYNFHRETALRRAQRRDREAAEDPPPDMSMLKESAAELLEALFEEVDMPERMRRVMGLVRRGLNHRQIAEALGIRQRTAQRWQQGALALLRRHCRQRIIEADDPNVRRAYLEQVSPNLYSAECHCAAGREACRRDGMCKHRWYLYQDDGRE